MPGSSSRLSGWIAFLRQYAAALLAVTAAASVALACCGADRALSIMRHNAACGALGALACASLAAVAVAAANARLSIFTRRLAPVLMHCGFALALLGWVGNAVSDAQDEYLRLKRGDIASFGRNPVQWNLPAANIVLGDFTIQRWPDTGAPRQYESRVGVAAHDETPGACDSVISVNHPYEWGPYRIYQSSYEERFNPHTGKSELYTILMVVEDWMMPLVRTGGILLILGAMLFAMREASRSGARPPLRHAAPSRMRTACLALYALAGAAAVAMLVHRASVAGHPPMRNMYEFLMCMAALIPFLTLADAKFDGRDTLLLDAALLALVMIPVGFAMDGSVRRLPPALQSPYFVPHVGAYALGYLLLVRAAFGAGVRFLGAGFFLMTLGLVLGAAWGKACWGHWWQCDPKEMWALASWLFYAAYFHVQARLSPRAGRVFLAAGAVLVVLTLTWVNLSRVFAGVHSYASA